MAFQNKSASDADRRSVLVGLVGRGIQKSRTPAMHEAEGRAQNLNYVYELLDADVMSPCPPLSDIVAKAEGDGFAGLNVTYPFKVEILNFLDELSPAAAAVGAVNTVVFRNGKRFGHNTDLWGFAENFRRNMADAPRGNVLLAGAGGAGAAVAHALIECGVETLWILDVDAQKAAHLAEQVSSKHGKGKSYAVEKGGPIPAALDGIVNATPMGMAKLPGLPVDEAIIQPSLWVADIVYFPLETELLRVARMRGCRVLSGAGMAVFQAVRAFELFTGIEPDAGRMEATFKAFDKEALV